MTHASAKVGTRMPLFAAAAVAALPTISIVIAPKLLNFPQSIAVHRGLVRTRNIRQGWRKNDTRQYRCAVGTRANRPPVPFAPLAFLSPPHRCGDRQWHLMTSANIPTALH